MTTISALARVLMFTAVAAIAQADILFTVTDSLNASDPTQTGRLSRNGIPQDWVGSESFPGVINTGSTYHYTTYAVNVGLTPFIQIDFDSISAVTFVSAYDTTYLPDSGGLNFGFDQNWLGDPGISGNYFGVDPLFFNVIEPVNSWLIVVVNQTTPGTAGLGDLYGLTVEGYIDSDFTSTSSDSTPPVPEPSGLILTATVLGVVGLVLQKRRKRFYDHSGI